MGLKYAFFHIGVHLLLASLIYFLFRPNTIGLIVILLGTVLIDLDHLSLWFKHGIKGYLYLRAVTEFGKPRKFFLHNFYVIALTGISTFIFLYYQFLILGIIFVAIFIHELFDLFEDVVVFNMGTKHWR